MSSARKESLTELTRAGVYDTDKEPSYLVNYDALFAPIRNHEVRLLEMGVLRGGSLLLWRDYFPAARIVGIDPVLPRIDDPTGRIVLYEGRQEDLALLDRVAAAEAPAGFDIIIDDAGHFATPARAAFWHLFANHLKDGGIYSIEDWGTGYWPDWPDGGAVNDSALAEIRESDQRRSPTHDYGMVGFVKELVDECGAADLSRGTLSSKATRASRFRHIQISHGQVIVIRK